MLQLIYFLLRLEAVLFCCGNFAVPLAKACLRFIVRFFDVDVLSFDFLLLALKLIIQGLALVDNLGSAAFVVWQGCLRKLCNWYSKLHGLPNINFNRLCVHNIF